MAPNLFWILILTVVLAAFWRGSTELRIVASGCLVAAILTVLAHAPLDTRNAFVNPYVVAIDVGLLALMVSVAMGSRRFWPLWIAGLHLVTCTSHVLKALHLDLLPSAYAVAERFWAYPILIILFVGVWRHHQRERQRLAGTRELEQSAQPV